MALQTFEDVLTAAIVAPTAISASTTETLIAPNYLLAANAMYQGKVLRINAFGVYTSAGATPGTIGFKVRMGTAGINTDLLICGSPLITLPVSGSNSGWSLEAYLTCQLIGATGNTVIGLGRAMMATVTSGVPLLFSLHGAAGATAPAAVAVSTVVANNIGVYAVFSSATTNTLQAFSYTLEELN